MIPAMFAVFVFAASLAQQPVPPPAAETAEPAEFVRLERVWNDAHTRGDAEALAAICADDLVVTVPAMTVMDKVGAVGFLRSGRMKFDRYQTSKIRVRTYGDAAIVTGRLQRTRVMNGRTVEDDWQFTKTYVRRAGAWLVAAFHASQYVV